MHRFAIALLGLSLAVPALAQDADCLLDPDVECVDATPRVVYRSVTEVDFEEIDVNAPLTRPSISMVGETAHKGFNPLIRFRTSFHPEMNQSVAFVQ